jgi:metal-responsive CopG/Arc/MetJ family transcriptional regulator
MAFYLQNNKVLKKFEDRSDAMRFAVRVTCLTSPRTEIREENGTVRYVYAYRKSEKRTVLEYARD